MSRGLENKKKQIRLTDKQKKKIIADYTINGNKRETGRINNVSVTTVSRVIKSCEPKVLQLVTQKKEDNTNDLLEYIDSEIDKQKKIIKLSFDRLIDKLEVNDKFTSPKDIVTVFGVLSDKALKMKELKLKQMELELQQKNINNPKKVVIVNELPRNDS